MIWEERLCLLLMSAKPYNLFIPGRKSESYMLCTQRGWSERHREQAEGHCFQALQTIYSKRLSTYRRRSAGLRAFSSSREGGLSSLRPLSSVEDTELEPPEVVGRAQLDPFVRCRDRYGSLM
jgi:hypothetical protein